MFDWELWHLYTVVVFQPYCTLESLEYSWDIIMKPCKWQIIKSLHIYIYVCIRGLNYGPPSRYKAPHEAKPSFLVGNRNCLHV